MKCKISLTAAWDRPFWIKWADFELCVDEKDLACRDSLIIEDSYLAEWFFTTENGICCFNPPAFYLKNGRAFFINGRHRTILLSRYLNILPMALTQIDKESQPLLDGIVEREIDLNEIIELPNLPIKKEIVADKT